MLHGESRGSKLFPRYNINPDKMSKAWNYPIDEIIKVYERQTGKTIDAVASCSLKDTAIGEEPNIDKRETIRNKQPISGLEGKIHPIFDEARVTMYKTPEDKTVLSLGTSSGDRLYVPEIYTRGEQ